MQVLHSRTGIQRTVCDVNCLYSQMRVMLKLARKARGRFVKLVETVSEVNLINCTCTSGHSDENTSSQPQINASVTLLAFISIAREKSMSFYVKTSS